MKKTLLIFSVLFAALSGAFAQTLSLDGTIRLAQDSTISSRLAQAHLLQSKWEYEMLLSGRRPQINFNLIPGYQKFSFEPNARYYKFRGYDVLDAVAQVSLEQKALNLGGVFYARSSALWTRYFQQDNPAQLFSTIPIGIGYANDLVSYNPHKWEKELGELRLKTSEKEFDYELRSIAREASDLYIRCFVAMRRYEICERNASVSADLLAIGREKFGMASISKNELSALELQSLNAENSLFSAKQMMEDCRGRLLSYLRIEDRGQVLDLQAPQDPQYKNIRIEDAAAMARANNPEYLRSGEDILEARQQEQKAKAQGRFIQGGVDVNVGLQSTVSTFANVYGGQQPYLYGNVTLRIPIYDGGLARSRKKVAEYRLESAENARMEAERKLDMEVASALREFNIQQDLLVRCSRALSLADDSFELARELYGNGESDINTFILAQDRKDEAHSNYLESLERYWDSYYTLRLLCGANF